MDENKKPSTLADIFFQIVERELPRVMMYEAESPVEDDQLP